MSPEQKIAQIKKKILNLGPILPGSISEQWNVCGTPGCACKSIRNPIKHGPYCQLSFSVRGKSSTMFIKKQDLREVQKRIRRFKELKNLIFELVQASVDLARKRGFGRSEQ